MKIPEKYAEELDILRSSHNYRAFSVLAVLLFGSCVIFLVQHLLVPDRYCADWVHRLYIRFYVTTLIASPIFVLLLHVVYRSASRRAVFLSSLIFVFGLYAEHIRLKTTGLS